MKKSMTVLGAAILLAASTSVLSAQGGRQGQSRDQAMEQRAAQGRPMAPMLLRGIALTDAQKDTLQKMQASFQIQQRELMQQSAGAGRDPAAMEKRRELMTSHQRAVRAVLTPEQQATFDQNVKAMGERRPGMRDRGDRSERPPRERGMRRSKPDTRG